MFFCHPRILKELAREHHRDLLKEAQYRRLLKEAKVRCPQISVFARPRQRLGFLNGRTRYETLQRGSTSSCRTR